MNISIVIPTKDRPKTLQDCVTSLISQSQKPLELVVVDDGHLDDAVVTGLEHDCRSSGFGFQYLRKERPGTAESRNVGARAAKGDFVLYLDDDMILESSFLADLIESWSPHLSDASVAAVAAIWTNFRRPTKFENIFNKIFGMASLDVSKKWSILPWGYNTFSADFPEDQVADWVPVGSACYRHDVLLRFPYMTIQPGRSGLEDLDHSWLLKQNGFHFFVTKKPRLAHHEAQIGREAARSSGMKEAWSRRVIFGKYGRSSKNFWPLCWTADGWPPTPLTLSDS